MPDEVTRVELARDGHVANLAAALEARVRHVVEMVPNHRPSFLPLHRLAPFQRVSSLDGIAAFERVASLGETALVGDDRVGYEQEFSSRAGKNGEVDGRTSLRQLITCQRD